MDKRDKKLMLAIKMAIEEYYDEHNELPTVRTIADMINSTKTTVHSYMQSMAKEKELIKTDKGYHTDLTIKMDTDMVSVPKLGYVPCGPLSEEHECIEGYIKLPSSLFGNGKYFLLTASGESMIEKGIDNGDLVLVKQQETAMPGDVVVALVDNEVTLKTFYPDDENKVIRLHPENSSMQDIIVDHCIVQGVAIKVIKDI